MRKHSALTRAGLAVVHNPPSQVRRAGWPDRVSDWLSRRAIELGTTLPRGYGPSSASNAGPVPFLLPQLPAAA